jgi:hypothetical protein
MFPDGGSTAPPGLDDKRTSSFMSDAVLCSLESLLTDRTGPYSSSRIFHDFLGFGEGGHKLKSWKLTVYTNPT